MKEPIETERVTDAALTRSIIASVIGIVLCMACLFGTTWAWYSSSVTSGASETVGANFDFSVVMTDNVEPIEGVYTFEGGTHTVTLTKTGTAEKGFCKVIAKTSEESETISYYIIHFTEREPVSFTVTGSGTLQLVPMLGTPTGGYSSIPGDGITLTPDPEMEVEQEEEEQEEPEPEDEPKPEEPVESNSPTPTETPEESEEPVEAETPTEEPKEESTPVS